MASIYSAEHWIITQKIEKKRISFKNKILWKIYSLTLEEDFREENTTKRLGSSLGNQI